MNYIFYSHLTSRVVSPHPEECLLEDSNDSENKEDCKVDSANSTQEKVSNLAEAFVEFNDYTNV